ncbi:tubulin polymerization-promoting protein homolog isoform X2 [Diorhabda carinulata]|nr:tubulin polymerization-promoting protein homolog isoform X2 [Diorhabda carinulata]XP_057661937.1 tubulin polymerization-promoting protein homolog isoform X2 [Diorhabda carinulata]
MAQVGPSAGPDAQLEIIGLDQQFVNFCNFQPDLVGTPPPSDAKSKAEALKPFDRMDLLTKTIYLKQIDFWFKQAGIFNKEITMTDTGLAYSKFLVKGISYMDFLDMLEDLCKAKEIELDDMKMKLQSCGLPGISKTAKATPTNA